MDFGEYQQAALKTDQPPAPGTDPVTVPLLGLLGEAGSVATVYKKRMRDGAAFRHAKAPAARGARGRPVVRRGAGRPVRPRPGRHRRRQPVQGRRPVEAHPRRTCSCSMTTTPPASSSPARAVFTLTRETGKGRPHRHHPAMRRAAIGDPLTDASHIEDDYRLHDVFHIAYAAVLGWSPVLRSLMKRKRKSNPQVDEAEDGGRAIAIEEGISALVFSYAARHQYLKTSATSTRAAHHHREHGLPPRGQHPPRRRLGKGDHHRLRGMAPAPHHRRTRHPRTGHAPAHTRRNLMRFESSAALLARRP